MKILKYLLVGAIAATIDFSIFGLLVYLIGIPWYWAGCIGFLIATSVNYLLAVSFVFKSGVRFNRSYEVGLVFLVSLIGLLLNQIILYLCIESFFINPLIAKLMATGGVFFWNYFARSKYIFKI